MAQGKGNKNGHVKKSHEKHQGTHDNDDHQNGKHKSHKSGDGTYNSNHDNSGKYSKNLPSKVRSSFNRDYPNATNVSWTKNEGYWTATFPNGIYRTSVTYSANGQRTTNSRRTRSKTANSQGGSVWDKILSKQ
jgi:hypothetical protein